MSESSWRARKTRAYGPSSHPDVPSRGVDRLTHQKAAVLENMVECLRFYRKSS